MLAALLAGFLLVGLAIKPAAAAVSTATAVVATATATATATPTATVSRTATPTATVSQTATATVTATATSTTTPTATATATTAAPAKPAVTANPVIPPAPGAAAQPSPRNTPAVALTGNPPANPLNPKGTPGLIALLQTTDGSERDPVNWTVRVHKQQHRLDVYYKGRLYGSYRAVFGRNLDTSAKVFAGDRRTPEGNYLIISKYRSRRWRWFLKLNYPNSIDLSRFEELRAAHEIPVATNAGGSIGIHGTDLPMLNEGNINWTTGCISVDNGAVDELAALLPVGTLVVITR